MKEKMISIFSLNETKIIVFILVIFYSFNRLFWGCDFTDTFYWINLFSHYRFDATREGTSIIGYFWASLFGDSLLSVRILAWLIGTLAFFLAYFLLIKKDLWIKKLDYLSFALVLLPFTKFSADVVTLLIISISLIFAIKYFYTHKLPYVFCLGASCSAAFFVRFPNVLLFLVAFCSLLIIESYFYTVKNKEFWERTAGVLLLFSFVYLVFFVVFSMLLNGSVKNLFSEMHASLATASLDKTHTLPRMIKYIWRDFNKLFIYIGALFLFDLSLQIYRKSLAKYLKRIVFLISYCLFVFFMCSVIIFSPYHWNLKLFLSATMLFIILKTLLRSKEMDKNVILSLLIVAFAMVAPMGSNTGLLKACHVLICFLPFLLVEFKVDQNLIDRNYLKPFIFLFIGLVIIAYTKPYEDEWISKLTTTVESEKRLKYIRTTPARAKYIQDVINKYSELSGNKKVMFFGKMNHIFYYLTHEKPLYEHSFWMLPNDKREVFNAEQAIKEFHPVVFYLPQYPQEGSSKADEERTNFEEMLIKLGYKEEPKKDFKVYFFSLGS
jgi:hypothetical protein